MDALREWMESDLDVIMVGTWMLCGNGWSLIWTLSWLAHGCSAGMDGVRSARYHGWHMDALREWMESDLDVIMVGTWMLYGNGWSLIWTLSWLAHGRSVRGKLIKHRVPRGFPHVKYEEVREMPRIPDFSLYTKQFLRARTR